MKKKISLCLLVLGAIYTSCGSVKDRSEEQQALSSYVNPFIGASTSMDAGGSYHGLGKTFPGATAPFGMVQVSPNTITGGDNGSGYSDEHTSIEGFAFTQMSGIGWYGDLGNLLVMPTVRQVFGRSFCRLLHCDADGLSDKSGGNGTSS